MNKTLTTISLLLLVMAAGCSQTYEVWESDHWRSPDYRPDKTRKAAVVMFAPWSEVGGEKIEQHGIGQTLNRNKTYAEAMIICLQQRNVRVVEQQLVAAAEREARMTLSSQTDVVSTKDLAERIGRQLSLDTIFYADGLSRSTFYQFEKKPFGANEAEAYQRQVQANQRGGLVPEDAKRCKILVHHVVGLTVRGVDVATGKIVWVGYRSLAIAREYNTNRPDALSEFGTIQELAGRLADDLLATNSDWR